MASTTNKNTQEDYCLQQKIFERNVNYNLYPYSQHGKSYQPGIPNKCIGVPHFSMNERSICSEKLFLPFPGFVPPLGFSGVLSG